MLDKQRIDNLYKIFQEADELIRDIKATTCTEVIPAILQLRYAGWHLVCYLKYDSDNKPNEEEYRSAVEHSERAKFEASRHGILFCMQAIKAFRETYDKDILPNVISKYSEKMHKFTIARDFIKIKGDKDTRAKACYEHFISLRNILDELRACEPELNEIRRKRHDELKQKQQEIEQQKEVNEELKKANKKQRIISLSSLAIAVIAVIVTVVIAIVS